MRHVDLFPSVCVEEVRLKNRIESQKKTRIKRTDVSLMWIFLFCDEKVIWTLPSNFFLCEFLKYVHFSCWLMFAVYLIQFHENCNFSVNLENQNKWYKNEGKTLVQRQIAPKILDNLFTVFKLVFFRIVVSGSYWYRIFIND